MVSVIRFIHLVGHSRPVFDTNEGDTSCFEVAYSGWISQFV